MTTIEAIAQAPTTTEERIGWFDRELWSLAGLGIAPTVAALVAVALVEIAQRAF